MDRAEGHTLNTLLKSYLASEPSAVTHLPFILDFLTQECFIPSPHLQKWINRVNTLLHSKNSNSRWAGLCLAYKTSLLSRNVMIQCAQAWLNVALPLLSMKEPIPVTRSVVNLCRVIFTSALAMPEFQRQVSAPSIGLFISSILGLLQHSMDSELKILLIDTLATLVPLYPSASKASQGSLINATTLPSYGAAFRHTHPNLMRSMARLRAVLHFTGGKVGGPVLWKKVMTENVSFTRNSLSSLRNSFSNEDNGDQTSDSALGIFYSLEKLHFHVKVICYLLRYPPYRSVEVPVGALCDLACLMLTTVNDDKENSRTDIVNGASEVSVIPLIWRTGCKLTSTLSKCIGRPLTTHYSTLATAMVFQLEHSTEPTQRLMWLKTLWELVDHCHPLHSPTTCSRLLKAAMQISTCLLPERSKGPHIGMHSPAQSKDKKKMRGYEGDEVFRSSEGVILPSSAEGNGVVYALKLIRILMRNPDVSITSLSLAHRIMLSILFHLQQMAPSSITPESHLHKSILDLVQTICMEMGYDSNIASRSLSLIQNAIAQNQQQAFELLIHPRLPPLARSLPPIEELILGQQEEGEQEAAIRTALGIGFYSDREPTPQSFQSPDLSTTVEKTVNDVPTQAIEDNLTVGRAITQPDVTVIAASVINHSGPKLTSTLTKTAGPSQDIFPNLTLQMIDQKSGKDEEVNSDEEMPDIELDSDASE